MYFGVGKCYFVNVGYTTMTGFIVPSLGVRYYLKEHSGYVLTNFNVRSTSYTYKSGVYLWDT